MKNTNSLSAPINSSGEQVCVLDGWLVRVKYKDCPDKVSVMANVRGCLLYTALFTPARGKHPSCSR